MVTCATSAKQLIPRLLGTRLDTQPEMQNYRPSGPAAYPSAAGPADDFYLLRGPQMIRVLIVDDHAFVRAQIIRVMSEATGIVAVGECTDGSDVASMAALVQPDVELMDVRMPRTSGTVATAQLMAQRSPARDACWCRESGNVDAARHHVAEILTWRNPCARITLPDDRCGRSSHARAGACPSSRDPRCGAAPSRAISFDLRIGCSWRRASRE